MAMGKATHPKVIGCILALVTLALFWPATRYGFIDLDDDAYVSGNPYVQQGFTRQSVVWAATAVRENYWLPATWLSFMADRELQGPGARGYHRTNVLLHAVNVFLLFLLAHRLTGHLWGSALLAALFGWHPQRVEAVVWISSRKEVLSTLFALLGMLAYARYVRFRGSGTRAYTNYALAWMAMAVGLMAKPMLVTFPFLLLLLDFWPLKRFLRGADHVCDMADAAGKESAPESGRGFGQLDPPRRGLRRDVDRGDRAVLSGPNTGPTIQASNQESISLLL